MTGKDALEVLIIQREDLLMAVRAWAKATGYQQKMPGAVAEMRDATVIR